MINNTLAKGIGFGLIGGLAGTLAMDLFMLGMFSMMGMPLGIFLSMIGEAVSIFSSKIGIAAAGGLPMGAATHYLIGLLLGVIFGRSCP